MIDGRIKFDDCYQDNGTTTLYFTAPKEMLKTYIPNNDYPEAISMEISLEFPMNERLEARYAAVCVGYMDIVEEIIYTDKHTFYSDSRHCITPNMSEYEFSNVKYGYVIKNVRATPPQIVKTKGIISRKVEDENMKVYKKVRLLKDGNCYPLFIDKQNRFTFGYWMHSGFYPTKGFAERSLGVDSDGNQLGGWHCCFKPVAPHLADELKNGEKRVWIECEAKGVTNTYDRPESQGGAWILAEWIKPIKVLSESEIDKLVS